MRSGASGVEVDLLSMRKAMKESTSDSLMRAAAFCRAHQCEKAIAMLETGFAARPCDPMLSYQIGICYSGNCRKHSLVSLPLAAAYFERAVEILGPEAPPARLAASLEALGNTLLSNGELERALAILERLALLYLRANSAKEWARVEYNLGNLCCDLATGGARQRWEEAVRHYRNALTVRTEQTDPAQFAATAQNLGTAYREMPGASHEENLRRAIAWYYAAFRACFPAHLPQKRADLHNNLGNAFLDLASSPCSDARNASRALNHFARALRLRNKTDRPRDYAVTQFNLGQSFLRLAGGLPAESARQAAACFHEALDGFLLCGDTYHADLARKRLAAVESAAV